MQTSIDYNVYLYTNSINNKKYVGITKNVRKRHKQHLHNSSCKTSQDYNTSFKRAIRKYGIEAFSLTLLNENVTFEEACTLEKEYIKTHSSNNPEYGYNITSGGKGFKDLPQESKDRMANKLSKSYEFINPQGNPITIKNLRKFCRENNLNRGNMLSLHNGTIQSSQGWTTKFSRTKEQSRFLIGKAKAKYYKFLNPEGKLVEVYNLEQFCRTEHLEPSCMNRLSHGLIKQHKQWTAYRRDDMTL